MNKVNEAGYNEASKFGPSQNNPPHVSDDFQIGPDGAYEHKEQQELLDEAYENYCKSFEVDPNNFNVDELVKGHGDQCWGYPILDHVKPTSKEYKTGQINAYLEGKAEKPFFYLTQQEFTNKCKTDSEFSEIWGLKIKERELSLEERNYCWPNKVYRGILSGPHAIPEEVEDYKETFNKEGRPTKLITVTYNNKTIVSYE